MSGSSPPRVEQPKLRSIAVAVGRPKRWRTRCNHDGRRHRRARIAVACAWIGNAGRIATTADRLDNAAELCCPKPSLGRAFLATAPV